MKRTIITWFTVLVASLSLQAQQNSADQERKQYFVFGPKIGLSVPNQNAVTNTVAMDNLLNGFNTGIQVGGYMRGMIPIRNIVVLYAQLDALYATDLYWGKGDRASSGCFNFPLTIGAGYKFKNGILLRGGGGPTYTINMYQTANTAYKGTSNSYQKKVAYLLRRDPWGFAIDLGADYKNWAIDLRFMNQFRSLPVARIADEKRYVSWGVTLGYKF